MQAVTNSDNIEVVDMIFVTCFDSNESMTVMIPEVNGTFYKREKVIHKLLLIETSHHALVDFQHKFGKRLYT